MERQTQVTWTKANIATDGLRSSINRSTQVDPKEIPLEQVRSMDDVRALAGHLLESNETLVAGHHDEGAANFTLYVLNLERGILVTITLLT